MYHYNAVFSIMIVYLCSVVKTKMRTLQVQIMHHSFDHANGHTDKPN